MLKVVDHENAYLKLLSYVGGLEFVRGVCFVLRIVYWFWTTLNHCYGNRLVLRTDGQSVLLFSLMTYTKINSTSLTIISTSMLQEIAPRLCKKIPCLGKRQKSLCNCQCAQKEALHERHATVVTLQLL
jgi:hypothetical protein